VNEGLSVIVEPMTFSNVSGAVIRELARLIPDDDGAAGVE
jgi:hypothetical protein